MVAAFDCRSRSRWWRRAQPSARATIEKTYRNRYRPSALDVVVIVWFVAASLCIRVVQGQTRVCQVTWLNKTGTHSFGAVLNSKLSTTVDCINYCADNASCVAVDVETTVSAISCWIYVDSSLLGYSESTPRIDQYIVYNRTCTNQATAQCIALWNNQTNVHSFGASLVSTAITLADCLSACVTSALCIAVDVDFILSPNVDCYMHTSSSNVVNVYPASGVNQYRLVDRCTPVPTCTSSWLTYQNTNSLNGVFYGNFWSVADCQAVCASLSTCVAVDVSLVSGLLQCRLHNGHVDQKNYNVYGTTQYVIVSRCSGQVSGSTSTTTTSAPATTTVRRTLSIVTGGCNVTWSCEDDTHSFGGTQMPPLCNTEQACFACCAADSSCVSVDVDANVDPAVCYTFSSSSSFTYTMEANGVEHCVIIGRDCSTSTTVTTTTSTTTSTSTTTTTTNPIVTTTINTLTSTLITRNTPPSSPSTTTSTTTIAPTRGCSVYWSCTENTRSNNGILRPLSCYTETGCQSCCQEDPDCIGFDIDFNQFPAVCYTYTSRELFTSTFPQNGVRHCAVISQVCTTSTTTTVSPVVGLSKWCDANNWACDHNRCVNASLRCNNVFDCMDLSDEQNCTSACSRTGGVSCTNGLCILPYQWCDGMVDCPDFSDEQFCTCKSTSYQCMDGLCIDQSLLCDGRFDCSEGEDEFNCSCGPGRYQCSYSKCIDNSLVCDGVQDCTLADDESSIRCPSCGSNQFKCDSTRRCIQASQRCDGNINCVDGSDEQNCVQFILSTAERRKRRDTTVGVVYPDVPVPISINYRGTSNLYFVCSDGWTAQLSDLACREMGFTSSANTWLMDNSVDSSSLLVLRASSTTSNTVSALTNSRSCSSSEYKISINCILPSCGWRIVSEKFDSTFIDSGSVSASDGAWPWHVAIYYDGVYQCAGSVVTAQWILTSARCVSFDSSGSAVNESKLTVRAGSIYLYSVDSQVQVSAVDIVNVNPAFDGSSWSGDIALVKLSRSLQFTSNVRPICLVPSSTNSNSKNQYDVCAMSGWTPTRQSISRSISYENTLRQVRVKPKSGSDCAVGDGAQAANDDTLLCVDQTSLTNNYTVGMGAAAACRDVTGTWSLVGIALGKYNDQYASNPLTSIAAHSDWINSIAFRL